ncbi:MAG TPA: acetate--CoA ligase family protein [Polyangia bacterium]|jgi:acyl-CoA synthetase (NDP forming)
MNGADLARAEALLAAAAAEGRSSLLEHEGVALLEAMGLQPPRTVFVPAGGALDDGALAALGGSHVIVKIVSPLIAHKTDVGGVRRVAREPGEVRAVIAQMMEEVPRRVDEKLRPRLRGEIRGFLVAEEVPHREGPGHELLIGVRQTEAFGPVLVLGMGGIHSEMWARALAPGRGVAMAAAAGATPQRLRAMLDQAFVGDWLLGRTRTREVLCDPARVTEILARFGEVAAHLSPLNPQARVHLVELECNPFVLTAGGLRPVDVLARFAPAAKFPVAAAPRPQAQLAHLLEPKTVALAGVSEKGQNVGRIILGNLLRDDFPRDRIWIVKPGGAGPIDGCRVVASVADLPEPVDLFVVCIEAREVPALVEQIEAGQKAAGVLLIPGGMGEKEGSSTIESRIAGTIRAAREAGGGAVYNGGNCLGLVSGPGRYDTLFIPGHKLPASRAPLANTAIVSQSGAFVIARLSKQPEIRPRYAISIGNQIDLTVSDYLRYLRGDPAVEVVALYVEGFRPLDGLRTAEEVAALVASGRDVVLYKAGRTAAGRSSTAGHTASIAGDYAVAAAVMREAGAWVADSIAEFEGATKLLSFLHGRPVHGRRVGAVSNAGFECVALADNIEAAAQPLTLPAFGAPAAQAMRDAFGRARIAEIVDVHNPLDVTPMSNDACFADDIKALLGDPGIDAAVVSIVPLTAAMNTLAADPAVHREDVEAETSMARRLVTLAAQVDKPFVVTVDSGRLYDRMVDILQAGGVPVFRESDTAMRLFARYLNLRLQREPGA